MRSIRSSSLIAMLFVAILAVPAGAAQSAAPAYVSSEPSNGEELHQAPDRVEVTFNEPLDESSDLTVTDSCGRTVDDGNVTVDANTITVGIKLQPSGHYEVSYLATGIGGLTGSTDGSFHFEVHAGAACSKSGGGGHKDHKNGNDDKNKNDDGHDDHNDGNGNRGDHGDGGGHSSRNHGSGSGGSGHSGGTHTAGGGGNHDNMDHSRKAGGHGGKHKKKGKGHGGGHGDGAHGLIDALEKNDNGGGTLAAGEGAPFGAPDGTAVMLALGLSLALGVLGGWFLRVSGGR